MGCEQSKAVDQAVHKPWMDSDDKAKRKTGIGATERLIGNYMKKAGLELPPDPKVNASGHLRKEEIVKRTKSSVTVSELTLGDYTKGSVVSVQYAYWTQRGYYPDDPHKENQDECGITTAFGGEKGDACFAVYDGHGTDGHDAAAFAKKNLPNQIAKYLRQMRVKEYQKILKAEGKSLKGSYKPELWPTLSPHAYEMACRKGFLECNKAMHDDPSTDCKLSGTTAVTVGFHMGRVTICNVGDSRVVLGHRMKGDAGREEEKYEERSIENSVEGEDGFCVAVPLTKDQTPYRQDERERVKKAGAVVCTIDQLEGTEPMHESWCGLHDNDVDLSGDPPRVWEEGKEYPGCAFTRSLGDHIADNCGVIAEPEMLTTDLTSNDEYMIIASDGVFEFLPNQMVVDICVASRDPLEACDNIVKASYEHWLKHESRTDDITVIVLFLNCEKEAAFSEIGTTAELVGKETSSDFKPIRYGRTPGLGGSIRGIMPGPEEAPVLRELETQS